MVGSAQLFADKYIDKENNDKLREMLFNFLTSKEDIKLNPSEHDDIDVSISSILKYSIQKFSSTVCVGE